MNDNLNTENVTVIENGEPKAAGGLDFSFILGLMKNPMSALKLDPKKHFLYGLIGLGASFVGYIIWALFIAGSMRGAISLFLAPSSLLTGGASYASVMGRLIFIGIISNIALFGSIFLISMWKATDRQSIQSLLTKLGAVQYFAAAGFILAGLLSFMTFKLSLAILLITLLTVLFLTLLAAVQMYKVKEKDIALYGVAIIAVYFIIMMVLTSVM